jgi:hypothetical protein
MFQSGPASLIRINAMELLRISGRLHAVAEAYGEHGARPPRDIEADPREISGVTGILAELCALAHRLGLERTERAATAAIDGLGNRPCGAELARIADGVGSALQIELAQQVVVAVPAARAGYLGQHRAFGESVYYWLPAARGDIAAASDCLALSLFTAAAFHCMRAVELAARHETGPVKPRTWAAYAQAMRASAQKAGERHRERWERAADRLDVFRNAWRNGTMHADCSFSEDQAMEVFMAARGFLRDLAEGVAQQ